MKAGDWTGVAALAGRRVDARGATEVRFPDAASPVVTRDVRRLLEADEVGTLVASAACGADIVALEAALGLGLRLVIVLPFEPARFRSTSVADRGEQWGKRFDALLSQPNARRELIVLRPAAGSDDDAAYAEATRRIVAEAERRAPADESPLAIAVWEGQARAGADATQDFIDQATAAGMRVRVVISRPDEAARRYLAGAREAPEHALDLREALQQSDPVLAYQLTTEVARRFLHEHLQLSPETVERAWKACKSVEAFGFARRILRRRIEALKGSQAGIPPAALSKLCQQQALCTSKDPDLAAALRHDWALRILKPDEHPRDSEHQGIAGGICKRKWEWDGSRGSLERSLEHYRAGIPDQPPGQQKRAFSETGYLEINCAFVLDLLASLVKDSNTSRSYRSEARALRQELTALKPTDKWHSATLVEAYVGLERFPEACAAMTAYVGFKPDPWELDTTLRQLVRLAHVCGICDADVRKVLAVAIPNGSTDAGSLALTSLLVGRVGLALSGGGFRASLFHLGVLARLAECDVLRHVEVLSCVSGGSIVGALYYQHLKQALEEHGEALAPIDYVRIVERVISQFVGGVSRNVRTGLLTNFRTSLAIVSGDNRKFAQAVAAAFQRRFYAQLGAGPSYMDELTVRPKEGPPHFHPGRHNWTRKNKVPTLVLNAATLNTGHSWQFTARSMGESPFTIQAAVDSNPRLRRANYALQPKRRIKLSEAVAASACVPGLFAPLQLDDLYADYSVRLVDGGVFDNQGTSSLIEQDCQVLLVSDAAGQLFSESAARSGHASPLMRSIGIFQERIRQSSYEGLLKRADAGQVRTVVYTHLTQGLGVPAVDWKNCEDPLQEDDQLPGPGHDQVGASVDRNLQLCLAKMRTDLDVFSEIECAALMASGYISVHKPLAPLLGRLRAEQDEHVSQSSTPAEHSYWFSGLLPLMTTSNRDSPAYRLLNEHLDAGALGVGRLLKLDKKLKEVAFGVALALVLALGLVVYVYRDKPLWTLGGLGLCVLLLALRQFAGKVGNFFGNLTDLLSDPIGTLIAPVYRYVAASVLTIVALIVVTWFDPQYLRHGELRALRDAENGK